MAMAAQSSRSTRAAPSRARALMPAMTVKMTSNAAGGKPDWSYRLKSHSGSGV